MKVKGERNRKGYLGKELTQQGYATGFAIILNEKELACIESWEAIAPNLVKGCRSMQLKS